MPRIFADRKGPRHSSIGRLRYLAAAVVLALVATTTASAQRPAATAAGARSFLWKVQSATGVLYLAGSVHALSPDVYPLNPAFDRAFEASGTLVEEIDLTDSLDLTSSLKLLGKGTFQDGRTFDQVVSKETAALVTAKLGLSLDLIRPMKPWMVDLMIEMTEMQKTGLDPNLGLDKHFFDKAKGLRKPVIGLETAESQIDRLDQMPLAVQEQMLRSTLKEQESERNSLATLVGDWRRGDSAALEKTLLSGFKDFQSAYVSLIVERNRNWIPQIEACLSRPSPCFVVVGAAHLVGPDGLLAILKQRGYRLEQQ